MQAKTTGWVGVGISPAGGMANADIYTGSVTNGVASVTVSIKLGQIYFTANC